MIKLMEIIDALESVNIDITAVYSRKENRIIYIYDGMEDDEELLEEIECSEDDSYVSLPDQYDIHEYQMMVDFVRTIEDERTQDLLFNALHGKGAFRRFKDTAHQLEVIKDWYEYRYNQYKRIAIEWCEENNIEYFEN